MSVWAGGQVLNAVVAAVDEPSVQRQHQLYGALALQALVVIVGGAVGVALAGSRELLASTVARDMTARLIRRSAELDVKQCEQSETHDAMQRAYADSSRPAGVVTGSLGLTQSVVTLVCLGGIVSDVSLALLPYVLAASLCGVIVSARFGVQQFRMNAAQTTNARYQRYLGAIAVSAELAKEVRLGNLNEWIVRRWRAVGDAVGRDQRSLVGSRTLWGCIAAVVSSATVLFAVSSVVAELVSQGWTVGQFGMVTMSIAQIQAQCATLFSQITSIGENAMYGRNILAVLDWETRDARTGKEWVGRIESIEFVNVSFRREELQSDVLKNVSFKVRRGDVVALGGPNGAGKSTLIKLLAGIYVPSRGQILLNGVDATRFTAASVQKEVGVVFQDFGRFAMSARENVVMGLPSRGDREIMSVACEAGMDKMLARWGEGLDTMLGQVFPQSRELSTGEWQRIALARCLYKRASVRIFDEATAYCDSDTQQLFLQGVRRAKASHISFVVSHTPSVLGEATRHMELREGTLSEATRCDEGQRSMEVLNVARIESRRHVVS